MPHPTVSKQWQRAYASIKPDNRLFYNEDGFLNVEITTDGKSIFPEYNKLARAIKDHPKALINLWLWDWPNLETITSILPHISLLYGIFDRWSSASFDIPLLNHLMKGAGPWVDFSHPRVHHFTSLVIRDIGRVGDLVPSLQRFLSVLCGSRHRNIHRIDICDSEKVMPSPKHLARLPFSVLTNIRLHDTRCSVAHVYEILKTTRDITEFHAMAITGPSPSQAASPVTCPLGRLRVLDVRLDETEYHRDRSGPVMDLLCKISPPYLQELTLGYEGHWNTKFIKFFVLSKHCIIERLHLSKIWMRADELVSSLYLSPNVTELTLDGHEGARRGSAPPLLFSDYSCKYYMVMHGGNHLTLKLKVFVVRDNCIERTGCFGRMVSNRFEYGSGLEELIILGTESVRLCHEDSKTLQNLISNRHRVRFEKMVPTQM